MTKQALADAYQGLAFASLADATATFPSSQESDTMSRQDSKTTTSNNKLSLYPTRNKAKSRFQYITERGFELYRSLLWADEHTKCAKLGVSHEDDILGVCLLISHFKYDKYLNGNGTGKGGGRRQRSSSISQLEIQRIKEVKVGLECVSLRYFRMFVAYYTSLNQGSGSGVGVSTNKGGKQDKHKRKQNRGNQSSVACWRFFPLIVDASHARKAKELLTHEMILADRVSDKSYTYQHLEEHPRNGLTERSASLSSISP